MPNVSPGLLYAKNQICGPEQLKDTKVVVSTLEGSNIYGISKYDNNLADAALILLKLQNSPRNTQEHLSNQLMVKNFFIDLHNKKYSTTFAIKIEARLLYLQHTSIITPKALLDEFEELKRDAEIELTRVTSTELKTSAQYDAYINKIKTEILIPTTRFIYVLKKNNID